MRSLGLEVRIQEFKFLSWELTRGPSIRLLHPLKRDIDAGFFLFSDDTPAGGVVGSVKRVGTMYIIEGLFEWPKYAVVDGSGRNLAYIIARPDGPALSFPLINERYYGCAPYLIIGQKEHMLFKKWLDEGVRIKAQVDIGGKLLPSAKSQNVVGTLKGTASPDEHVVVCAHYDSAYSSPGANDNASGVEAMLSVAKRLTEKGPRKTVKFIAFGAEEYWLLGSRFYVDSIKERGELSRIKAVINYDTIGVGDCLRVRVEPEDLKRKVKGAIESSGFNKKNIVYESPKRSSDHWPFYEKGIPVVHLVSWPENFIPHYHQSTDTSEKIREHNIGSIVKITTTLIEDFSEDPK